jgi:hypothetical protein
MFSKARIRGNLVYRICGHLIIELTGEKIYDEFDPHDQGAQRSSFIPPGSDAGDTVTTIAIIDPSRDESHNRVHAAGYGI